MKSQRVLLITQPSCGGAERITLLYGKILEEAGFGIDLLLLKLLSSDSSSLISYIPQHWSYSLKEDRLRKMIFHTLRYIRATSPDIVFSSMFDYSLMLLLLKRLHLISCKVVVRELNMPSSHSKLRVHLSRLLLPCADRIISQTEEMKLEMMKHYGLKESEVVVINNPIDKQLIRSKISEEADLPSGSTVFVACCRLDPQKDIVTLIKAFSIVLRSNPKSLLYIIGEQKSDDYMLLVQNCIRDNGLTENVIFTGFQSNPYIYMNRADVFVLSSIYEGLPNAMLEAMYLGRPVAATRCIPYISQVVHDGENGYTCPVGDYEELASCMMKATEIKDLPFGHDPNNSESVIIHSFSHLFSN